MEETIISWSSSINENNARSIGVSKNGLVYLPALISCLNPELGDVLDAFINENAKQDYNDLITKFKTNDSYIEESGSIEYPYLIKNIEDLSKINKYDAKGVHFKLTNDITFDATENNGSNFKPIDVFRGILDGDGHYIENINIVEKNLSKVDENINGEDSFASGFIRVNYGLIQNLKINHLQINFNQYITTNSKRYVFCGFVGYNANSGVLQNILIDNASISVGFQCKTENNGDPTLRMFGGILVGSNKNIIDKITIKNSYIYGKTDEQHNGGNAEAWIASVTGFNGNKITNILSMNNTIIGKACGGYSNKGVLKAGAAGIICLNRGDCDYFVSLNNSLNASCSKAEGFNPNPRISLYIGSLGYKAGILG